MIDTFSGEFQRRHEPNFAWVNAVSATLALPGLRGCWPTTCSGAAAAIRSVAGQQRHLTYNGNPTFGYNGLTFYVDLDGTGDFFDRPDEVGLDILGTETYNAAAVRGCTLGLWASPDTNPGAAVGLWGKYGAAGQRSYHIHHRPAGTFRALFSSDGTNQFTVDSAAVVLGTWNHVVARFKPSATVDIIVNGVVSTLAAGIPASLFNSTASLDLGRRDGEAAYFDGKVSLAWLSCMYLSNTIVRSHFHQTRALYNA